MDTPSRLMTDVRRRVRTCSTGRANIGFSPKLQSLPQQINPFSSMQSDSNFKRAFGDTQIPS